VVPKPSPLRAALYGTCPRCGEKSIFSSLLKVHKSCTGCQLPLSREDSADGPAFFAIVLVGFLVTGLATWVELAYEPPLWLHLVLWPVATLLLSLWQLRFFKAMMIAYQYKLLRHEFDE